MHTGTFGVVPRTRGFVAWVEGRRAAWAGGPFGAWTARRVVVGGPLPHVSGRVVEPVAVGSKESNWGGAAPSLGPGVAPREFALPEVGHQLAAGLSLVSPCEGRAVEAASRGVLPFGFARQLVACPVGVRLGVLERDMGDGVLVAVGVVAVRAPGVAPVGAGDVGPPAGWVVQRDRPRGWMKDG